MTDIDPQLDDILDCLFHFSALKAYLEQAALCGGFSDETATKHRAYALYEQMLAERRTGRKSLTSESEPW